MYRSFLRFICVFVLFPVFAQGALAQSQPLEVTRALAWLTAQVMPDGRLATEAQSIATPFQSRVETANTLRLLATLPASLEAAIRGDSGEGTEDLARKLILVTRSGGAVGGLVSDLLARQNFDGGFVPLPGFASNSYDSAWAVVALAAAGVAAGSEASRARAYLRQAQMADGGIGIGTDISRIVETSIVLDAFRTSAELTYATARSMAAGFLKGRQASDGSWGGDVYLTANTFNALAPEGVKQC